MPVCRQLAGNLLLLLLTITLPDLQPPVSHGRVVVVKVKPQQLPPHGLITRGLHSHSSKGNQQHMASIW